MVSYTFKKIVIDCFPTVEPRSTDTLLIQTPGYYGQFRLSGRTAHTFSLTLTGQRTLLCVPSDKKPYIVNSILRTLSEYLNFENRTDTANGLSKGCSSTLLSCKLNESVSAKKIHGLLRMIWWSSVSRTIE